MGRLCERPGCSERGSVAYGFDADRLLVWLAAFDPDAERSRAGVLCKRHADSMVVPVGWTLDDTRDPKPPLFKPPRAPRRKRQPRRQPSTTARGVAERADELPLGTKPGHTVAELSGSQPDDPDATVAMPWMPAVQGRDDRDGLRRADSPLLARAFRGSARQR
ncbi:MAG TPA: hypothetical protein VFP09_04625 [Desertimonas sp.]|nr:hypothetical protein [Desertimonas sp.]